MPEGDSDAAVLEAAYEGRGERIAALERECDRLREAARGVVIAYLAFHQPTMKAAIEKLVMALDA